jgi:cob(I)alamin adenosyltransferase
MKIYTKTGDAGETGLFGGGRVSKAHPQVEAYGAVDELNSAIGVARSELSDAHVDAVLTEAQSTLFDVGAELATKPGARVAGEMPRVSRTDVQRLEQAIDDTEQELDPLKTFVLPGGGRAAAQLHYARTVGRRAERRLVALKEEGTAVREDVMEYLNRLGDLLFVLARLANKRAGIADVPWQGRRRT